MEVQIKKAVKSGNSAAVILPRAWLNKEVRIEIIKKTPETMLTEAMSILKKYINLKDIIGVYLTGSYARGEEDEDSDIDILVITSGVDREIIKEGIYSILVISSELLKQKLKEDLFPIGPMIKEAIPLLNHKFLSSIEVNVTEKNVLWYLNTTEEKLNLIKKIIAFLENKRKKYTDNKVAYTLVLRIRTLHIILKLIRNESYSKKEFINLINKVSAGKNAYEGYLAVKNNKKLKQNTSIEEIKKLNLYLDERLEEAKKVVG
jgi:predicted nucleotidyltransferase